MAKIKSADGYPINEGNRVWVPVRRKKKDGGFSFYPMAIVAYKELLEKPDDVTQFKNVFMFREGVDKHCEKLNNPD